MKNLFRISLLIGLCLFLIQLSLRAQTTIIHAGNLIDIPGESPKQKQTLVIQNGRISAVHAGYKSAASLDIESANVIDLKDQYVMPGFIDMHTHITGERDPSRNPHEWTTLHNEELTLMALPYLKRTLMAGFTTVRDLGADFRVIKSLQSAINKSLIEGPRIIAATGAVSATGGHGDFHGYRPEIIEAMGPDRVGICDGSEDCRRAVRALVKQGADVIKITATGGVLSNTSAGLNQQLTDEELKAAVETAHNLGRQVAAHAHSAAGKNAALRAGVNSIEHVTFMNEETIRLFKETGAYLVPTLWAGASVRAEMKVNDKIPPAIVDKVNAIGLEEEKSFKMALAGNVKIAFGTDCGVGKHGTNANEFELMVKYGMSEAEAIKSATIHAADLLKMSDQLGTLEAGKQADIIAVDENPLENIKALYAIDFVMKGGKVFR